MTDTIIGKQIGKQYGDDVADNICSYIKNTRLGRFLFVPAPN